MKNKFLVKKLLYENQFPHKMVHFRTLLCPFLKSTSKIGPVQVCLAAFQSNASQKIVQQHFSYSSHFRGREEGIESIEETERIGLITVPPKAAIISEWPLLSFEQFTCDIKARGGVKKIFLKLISNFKLIERTTFCGFKKCSTTSQLNSHLQSQVLDTQKSVCI